MEELILKRRNLREDETNKEDITTASEETTTVNTTADSSVIDSATAEKTEVEDSNIEKDETSKSDTREQPEEDKKLSDKEEIEKLLAARKYDEALHKAYERLRSNTNDDSIRIETAEDLIVDTFLKNELSNLKLNTTFKKTLKSIFLEYGFNKNPFTSYLKKLGNKLTNDSFIKIYNCYATNIIDERDLNSNNTNHIIYNPAFLEASEEDSTLALQTYIWFEEGKNIKKHFHNLDAINKLINPNKATFKSLDTFNPKDPKFKDLILYTDSSKNKLRTATELKDLLNSLSKGKSNKKIDNQRARAQQLVNQASPEEIEQILNLFKNKRLIKIK